ARAINRGYVPVLPSSQAGQLQEPLFLWLVKLTAAPLGWHIDGARLAGAILGVLAALACWGWYRRALGPGWAIVGGLLVASTFPQLALSRQALPAVGAAACSGVALWALTAGLDETVTALRRSTAWVT